MHVNGIIKLLTFLSLSLGRCPTKHPLDII
jgi:hypothetical protein